MARKSQFPPRMNFHKASGQARCWVNGRWVYLGAFGSPDAQYRYAGLVAELADPEKAKKARERGTPTRPKKQQEVTVSQVLAAWAVQQAPRLSERGRERGQYALALAPLERLFGQTPAKDLDANRLEDVQLAMASGSWLTQQEKADRLAGRKAGRGKGKPLPIRLSAGVVNRRVVRIRTVWRWAERKGLVPRGSWANLLTLPGLEADDPRVRHTKGRPPARWEDVKKLIRFLKPVVRAMVLMQWWTGARSGEVRKMRQGEITNGNTGLVYTPKEHKNDRHGHLRIIPLGPRAMAVLRPWIAGCSDPTDFVFPAHWGRKRGDKGSEDRSRCYTAHTYSRAVSRAAARAGVDLRPYDLRHAAKDRITRAAGVHAARAVLGHKHLSTTDSYGAGVDVQHAAEVQRRIG